MQYINKDQVVMFDVDDTLITDPPKETYTASTSMVRYPVIKDPYTGKTREFLPMYKNIELMKKWKARGRFVIVWSAGGHAWALTVIKALSLEAYVDLVMEKPIAYVDDLTANEFMGSRVFLK